MIMAALLYIRRVTVTTTVSRVTQDYLVEGLQHTLQDREIPDDVTILRIHGPFLFGATDKLAQALEHLDAMPAVVIVRLRNMTAIDATGLQALEEAAERIRASGRHVLFCGAQSQPRAVMEQAGFPALVGPENFCPHIEAALVRAAALR
jgi:SulP family sulfate permease